MNSKVRDAARSRLACAGPWTMDPRGRVVRSHESCFGLNADVLPLLAAAAGESPTSVADHKFVNMIVNMNCPEVFLFRSGSVLEDKLGIIPAESPTSDGISVATDRFDCSSRRSDRCHHAGRSEHEHQATIPLPRWVWCSRVS